MTKYLVNFACLVFAVCTFIIPAAAYNNASPKDTLKAIGLGILAVSPLTFLPN
jgi:hypothetical protein